MSNGTRSKKQTRETARIARELRKLYSRGLTWEGAAREAGILKENGEPDPGLAYRIALQGYEPKKISTRERLGLKKICFTCLRGFRKVSRAALSPWVRWWRGLPKQERDRRIRSQYEKEKK